MGNVVEKINNWVSQGVEICYLSSHEAVGDIKQDKFVLDKYNFSKGKIYWRQNGEQYKNVAEPEMTYPHIREDLKPKIKSIVVKEFQGIDHLPENLALLLKYPHG